MSHYATANDLLNRVAPEIGVSPVSNPYASTNRVFTQLRYLLDSTGQELIELYPWQQGVKEHQITTDSADSGNYTLPDDFSYMIDQTGWERANDQPLYGPLSAQDWTYLLGRDLVSTTIYGSFRLKDGKFSLFPQPPVLHFRRFDR